MLHLKIFDIAGIAALLAGLTMFAAVLAARRRELAKSAFWAMLALVLAGASGVALFYGDGAPASDLRNAEGFPSDWRCAGSVRNWLHPFCWREAR